MGEKADVPDFGQFLRDESGHFDSEHEHDSDESDLDRERMHEEQRRECILVWDALVFPSQDEKDQSAASKLEAGVAEEEFCGLKPREGVRRFIREGKCLKLLASGSDVEADSFQVFRNQSSITEPNEENGSDEESLRSDSSRSKSESAETSFKRESSSDSGLKVFTGKIKGIAPKVS